VPGGWQGVTATLGMYRGWGNASGIDLFADTHGLEILYGHEFGDNSQWQWFTSGTNFGTWEAWVNARSGRRFTYSAPLLTGDTPGTQAQRYAALADGEYDHHFTQLGQAFQARPALRNAIVRLGWEFNGQTFPWMVPPNDQTTLDNYKVGFARASAALRAACPTLEVEWCPNIQMDYTNRTFADMVPDPSSFDYVGLGQYDYYWPGGNPTPEQRADWLINGQNGENGWQAQVDLANELGKPPAWTEYGLWWTQSVTGGGDRPAYIHLVADWMQEHGYAYHIYNNVTADGGHDLDDFPNARAAFIERFGIGAQVPDVPSDPTPDPDVPEDQRFYDFADDTVGSVPDGWYLATGAAGFAVSDAAVSGFGAKHLRFSLSGQSAAERALFAEFADGQQNATILARCRIIDGEGSYFHQLYGRAQTNPASRSVLGYYSEAGDTRVGIDSYDGGTWSEGPSTLRTAVPANATYRMELRGNGSAVELRMWLESEPKPSQPTETLPNSSSGRWGVGGYAEDVVLAFDWVGVGIDGAAAPTQGV